MPGCGTGYGVTELARDAAWVVGADIAAEAIALCPRTQSACRIPPISRLRRQLCPFAGGAFDLVTAFEVIEHLAAWRDLLSEARRVLAPDGSVPGFDSQPALLCGLPKAGRPQPLSRSRIRIRGVRGRFAASSFLTSQILFQNRVEAFAFHGTLSRRPVKSRAAGSRDYEPANAHFFIGVCAAQALPDIQTFLYVPRAANILARARTAHSSARPGDWRRPNSGWTKASRTITSYRAHEALNAPPGGAEPLGHRARRATEGRAGAHRQLQDEFRTE